MNKPLTKSFKNVLKYQAKQFCMNTALHGYRFIVLPKRILLERIFWVIIVLVSLITAVCLLCIAWTNFQQNPTLVVTDSTHHPIWNYHFPAVTICSFNTLSKRKTMELAQTLTANSSTSPEEMALKLRYLYQLISNNNLNITEMDFAEMQDVLESNGLQVETTLRSLTPPCNAIIQRCKWKGEEKRCESIFEQVATSEGFCCSFNLYALKNHTFSGILPEKIPVSPRRISACGYLTGLEVLVNSDPSDYFATDMSAVGHKILIHDAYSFPDWNAQIMLTEKGIINLIGITPTLTVATSSIKTLRADRRKCFFRGERELQNLVHTFHNCMTECRMNISKRLCGCIPFYYHNPTGSYNATKICNLRDVLCLTENKGFILGARPVQDQNYLENECNCIQDCQFIDYLAEASSGILTRKYASNQQNLYGGVTIEHQSVIRIYFNDLVGTKNRRDVTFSWHTLLAYYGGLLGLFIGFSFVSAVELIYFFTIRLVMDANAANNSQKKSKVDKMEQVVHVKPSTHDSLDPRALMRREDRYALRRRSNSNS